VGKPRIRAVEKQYNKRPSLLKNPLLSLIRTGDMMYGTTEIIKALEPSETHTTCPWKGLASYYNVKVNGAKNPDAAWYYPEPKSRAQNIKGYVAFWRGVKVEP
jgi:hypothetical protein